MPRVQHPFSWSQEVSLSKWYLIFSIWAALSRMTVGCMLRSVPGYARPHLHSIHCPAFYGVSGRSRPAPRFASETASSFQHCCMVWRAPSSYSPMFATLSPLWSVVFGSSWVSQSGRRSTIPPCTRWQSSREYLQSSRSVIFIFSGTFQGCSKTSYLGSFSCVPLLVTSILLEDRSDGGMTLWPVT